MTKLDANTETENEARRVLNFLASAGSFASTTVESKVLKRLLLSTDGTIMSRGYLYGIITEHLGAGVYKVTLRRTT